MLTWLMKWQCFHAIVFVDDFVGCEASLARMCQPFECLQVICNHLGHRLAPDECPSPRLA